MELRAARRGERDEVLDLLALWYGDRDFFARYNRHDPGFRDDLCLVACDAGRIVATVQIFDRSINLRGAPVPMGGIGSVYTLESWRGRGLASALMRLAVATMGREGFELSLLFAERLDFYARFGWRAATRQFTAVADAQAIVPDGEFDLARFDETRDLPEVAALHRAYSGRFETTVVRDERGWRGNLRYAGNPGEYFVVARRPHDRAIAAYARAMMFHGFPMVMEYGYGSDAAGAMVALFAHLGHAAAGLGSSPAQADGAAILRSPAAAPGTALIVTHGAHDPDLEGRLSAAGAFLMHHPDNFYMWRVIAPARLAERLNCSPTEVEANFFSLLEAPNALYWTADRF
ncbi:MAG TPA: GNAT family N-acetyltransferase [Candidatus Binataceae bacterium]|jgi:predicted N-acetyltransferase YhbS|nr:GNAT family N-acetyltransferase [Candidatus Binataceae bacterium]